MSRTHAQQELAKLRGWRTPPPRDLGLASLVDGERKRLVRCHKAVGGMGLAWEEVVPPRLAAKVELLRLTRGVLSVRVKDSATRFELDRFLRSGGEAELVRRAAGAIRRVKVAF